MDGVRIEVVRLDPGLPLPSYQRVGDAGMDLHAAQDASIPAGARAVVGTGIAVAIPVGYAGFVTPRSGLAARLGLSIVNAPGVVDSGYRGEIKVILVNTDAVDVIEVRRGDRIAQMLIVPVAAAELVEVAELPPSERGTGGHGSTGV
jgi:dUTP pyrophosphatase